MSDLKVPSNNQASYQKFQNPKEEIGKDLELFCEKLCPGVTPGVMNEMIKKGEELGKELVAAAGNDEAFNNLLDDPKITNPESAVHLIWALTAQAVKQGDAFTSGSMRLGTKGELTAVKLEAFFKACGQGQAYTRIASTHMQENLTKTSVQWGLDLRDMGLPADKHTILFARQPDGSFFLKLESAGCPPFWKKGFATWKNFKEFAAHALQYIKTRPAIAKIHFFINRTSEDIPKLESRKEHVPKEIKKQFKLAMKAMYPDKKIADEKYLEGKKYGISRMKKILDAKDEKKLGTDPYLAKMRMERHLDPYLEKANTSQYEGEIKGNEVLLAPLGTKGFYGQPKS